MTPKMKPCKHMFSNGSEYAWFLENQCYECKRFRRGRCKVFRRIEESRWVGESSFPFDYLLDYEKFAGKRCKLFTEDPIPRKRPVRKPMEGQIKIW